MKKQIINLINNKIYNNKKCNKNYLLQFKQISYKKEEE